MTETDYSTSIPELTLTEQSRVFLLQTSKWAKFLGIMSFIGTGVLVLVAFSMGSIMAYSLAQTEFSNMSSSTSLILTIVYLLLAIVYFFPALFLFKYASDLRSALDRNDELILQNAFEQQNKLYKYLGVFTIVGMSIYLLSMFAVIIMFLEL